MGPRRPRAYLAVVAGAWAALSFVRLGGRVLTGWRLRRDAAGIKKDVDELLADAEKRQPPPIPSTVEQDSAEWVAARKRKAEHQSEAMAQFNDSGIWQRVLELNAKLNRQVARERIHLGRPGTIDTVRQQSAELGRFRKLRRLVP